VNLEQQKKRARELLRAVRSGDPVAIERLRRQHPRWASENEPRVRQLAALHDAQYAVAREQGFSSWPKLKTHAQPSSDSRHTRVFVTDVAWIADRARGLLHAQSSGVPAALDQIREWHPRFADATNEDIQRAALNESDARLVYAREHGFEHWDDLAARVRALADGRGHEPFVAAYVALEASDGVTLRSLLRAHPELVRARGTNGNTLLNLATSLLGIARRRGGDVPTDRTNAPDPGEPARACLATLLDAGADADESNDRGWTPLHQAAYSNLCDAAELLIGAGAAVDAEAHGSGGTPLVVALFWGHREVSDRLASHAVVPGNLRTAAGVGDAALIDGLMSSDNQLTAEASAARGFYRPHTGFPDWQPGTSTQEVLDEALVWACKSDRVEVLDRLMNAGARLDADPYRGTSLLWAAACNRVRAAAWLLDHGADVNQGGTFGGASHGQGVTALHLAAQAGHLPIARLLVERGADLDTRDDLHHATPAEWATFFTQKAVGDFLHSVGGR
jgi:ankyrin repeat protein